MRGFKPHVAQQMQAQNFADGGIVKGIQRLLRMDPERNARLAEYRAREAQEKQAAAHAAKPPAQTQPQKALSQYAAGNGLERRMKEAEGYKNGGPVRGPGTGTSDDVPDQVAEGTYIMPTDSTQAIGEQQLGAMGKQIPVNLSNGEYKMPPEQVHAVGVQALDQMKDATHQPAPQNPAKGLKPEMFFASGGQVRDPNRPDIPVVGTRGPVRGGGGGGLSADAVAQARQQQPTPQAQKQGMAGLTSNPVTNPEGVTRDRMRVAGFAGGGVVEDEEKKRPNFFPGNSPDAGANVYGGAGMALGTSGLLASGAENVIGAQPPKTAAPVFAQPSRAAPVAQQPAATPATQPGAPQPRAGWQDNLDAMNAQNASPAAPTVAPVATRPSAPLGPQAAADLAAFGGAWSAAKGVSEDAGRAILDVATMVPRGAIGAYDSAVVRPMRAAGIDASYLSPRLVPDGVDPASMTPFTDQKRMREQTDAAAPGAQKPAAAPPTAPASPGVAPTPAARARAGQGAQPAASTVQNSTQEQPEPQQVMPGIYRSGNSYSDSAKGLMGFNTGQPNAQNMRAADNLAARSGSESMGRVQASIQKEQYDREVAQAQAINAASANAAKEYKGSKMGYMRQKAMLDQQNAQMQDATSRRGQDVTAASEAGRNAMDGLRIAMDGRRMTADEGRYALDAKAKGFDIRQAERMEGLQNEYLAAQNDPKKAEIVLKKIRDLSGKTSDPAARYTAVSGGQEWDAQAGAMRNVPGRVLNNQTGQWVQDGPAPAQAPIGQNPKALAIKNDTKMTTEQKRAALAQLGY